MFSDLHMHEDVFKLNALIILFQYKTTLMAIVQLKHVARSARNIVNATNNSHDNSMFSLFILTNKNLALKIVPFLANT